MELLACVSNRRDGGHAPAKRNAVEGCHRDADLKDRCSGRPSCRLFEAFASWAA